MAVRTVKLTLEAKVDGLVNGLKTGKKAVSDFGRDLESWRKKNEASLDTLGSTATKAGLGITAGLALAGKAAMDWESAWTGVTKTVDGSAGQMAQLEGELRGLAKTLPSTHAEIAGVAEAAGQLGVAREDITAFTKTMIDLSETTNLTADAAATSIAQFMNVMGTSGDKVDELGSSLVALGNDGASTEADIMSMATRLSGAGKLVGAAESDVLALANAMSSVGIEAELGGGVMTRVMTRMYADVKTGGEGLDSLAKVAGVSATEFATAFENDPVRAVDMMVRGLESVKDSGGNVVDTMKELGIKGTEEVGTLLRLAGAGDLLTSSLDLGTQAWEENAALLAEAEKRYGTTEAKVTIAWNNIKDAAITAGSVLLPIIANIADGAAGIADVFGSIPKPIQGFITVLGGISGAGLLAVGGLIGISKKAAEVSEAFSTIQGTGGRAQKTITGVSKALSGAVIVGAAIVAGKTLIEGINEAARSGQPDLEAYFNLLSTGGGADVANGLDLGNQGNLLSSGMLKEYSKKLGDVTTDAAAAKRAIEAMGTMDLFAVGWTQKNLSMFGLRDATEDALKLKTAMGALGRAFEMGETANAQQAFADIAAQFSLTDQEVATLINRVPELKSALTNLATDNGIQIDPNNELGLVDLALGRIQVSAPGAAGAIGGVVPPLETAAEAAERAKKEVDDFYDALVNIGAIALSERDALRGLEESFDAAADAATKNGKTLDRNTEKGRANEAALDGIADKTLGAVRAQEEAGRSAGDMAATMEAGRATFIKTATDMGMGAKAANALADELNLIPENTMMDFETNADGVSQRVSELYDWIKAAPDGKIQIDDNSPEVRKTLEALGFVVKDLPDGKIEVSEKGADQTGKKIDGVAGKKRNAPITTSAITSATEAALDYLARDRNSTINTHYTESGAVGGQSGNGAKSTATRNAALATGGPVFGAGTGTSDSIPALLSNGEHVWTAEEVGKLGGHSQVESLRAMALRGELPAFKTGGRVGWSKKEEPALQADISSLKSYLKSDKAAEKSAQRAYENLKNPAQDIPGDKDNRDRKRAAQKKYEAEKKRLKRAAEAAKKATDRTEKQIAATQKELQDSKARTARLSEGTFDLKRDLKRGTITEAFTSGGGMGMVDRMFEASNNKDLSKKQRSNMRSMAYGMEKELLQLEKQADKVAVSLDKATKSRDELRSVKNATRDQILGSFDMGSLLGQKDAFGYDKPVNKSGLLSYGKGLAAGAKKLHSKVQSLQRAGFNESMISQVIDEWTTAGTFELADAMLSMNKGERNSFNASFDAVSTYGYKTGHRLTEAMQKGGLNAADGLVNGLQSKQKDVDSAFYKMGKSAEKAFKKSLGIKSPSKVMFGAGVNVGEGAELGILSKVSDVQGAMGQLAAVPAFSVPPSAEVARYSAQSAAAPAVVIDYDRLAQAMTNVQLNASLQVDRRQAGTLVSAGQKFNGTHG